MTIFDAVLVAVPFAAATWAAWWLPRWAGENRRPERTQHSGPPQLWEPAVSANH